jgi:hypothetical protein
MSETIRKYVSQFPHARATTIQYLAKRDEMTDRLRREATLNYQRDAQNRMQKPRWSLLAWLLGRV